MFSCYCLKESATFNLNHLCFLLSENRIYLAQKKIVHLYNSCVNKEVRQGRCYDKRVRPMYKYELLSWVTTTLTVFIRFGSIGDEMLFQLDILNPECFSHLGRSFSSQKWCNSKPILHGAETFIASSCASHRKIQKGTLAKAYAQHPMPSGFISGKSTLSRKWIGMFATRWLIHLCVHERNIKCHTLCSYVWRTMQIA